jgi:hypothetical protein
LGNREARGSLLRMPWTLAAVEALCSELAVFSGYRSLFVDRHGHLWHVEPDVELEEEGFRHVATLMRPTPELLVSLLTGLRLVPVGEAATPCAQPSVDTAFLTAS